jgi:hypothetical protein
MPFRFRLPITKPISPFSLWRACSKSQTYTPLERFASSHQSQAFRTPLLASDWLAQNGIGLVAVVLLVFGAGEFGRPAYILHILKTHHAVLDIWKAAIAAGSDCFGVHFVNLSPALSLRVGNFAGDET